MTIEKIKRESGPLLLLAATTIVAFALINSPGTTDMLVWLKWMFMIEKFGVVKAFILENEFYPPISYLILWVVAGTAKTFRVESFLTIKWSLFLAFLISSATFYHFSRDFLKTAFFQISVMLSSVALAYLDIYYAPFLIVSLWALNNDKVELFAFFFTIAFLIKWQPVVLLPFIIVYILEVDSISSLKRIDYKKILRGLIPALVVIGIVFLIFGKALVSSLLSASMLGESTVMDPAVSANALNVNWIVTFFMHLKNPESYGGLPGGLINHIRLKSAFIPILVIPKFVAFAFYAFIFFRFVRLKKSFTDLLLYSLLAYLSYFTFYIGVHENHLFVACILTALLYGLDKKYFTLFLLWSLASNINMVLFYGFTGGGPGFNRVIGGFDTSLFFAALNFVFFAVLFVRTLFRVEGNGYDVEGEEGC
jgi:hypothetical protein